MLRHAVGGGGVRFPGKSITNMYNPTLLALRGGGSVPNFQSVVSQLNGPKVVPCHIDCSSYLPSGGLRRGRRE